MKTKLGYADFTFFLSKFKFKQIDDSGIMDRAAEQQLECVQVDLALKMEAGEAAQWRADLKSKSEQLGIELVGAAYGDPTVEMITQALQAGKELNARVVRYACGPQRIWQPPLPPDELVGVLKDIAPIAEKNGQYFSVENHQDYTADEMVHIMSSVGSPHVGIYLDTGNSIALMEDPLYTVEKLAPFTHGIHMKEYVVLPAPGGYDLVGVGLGQGVVDNQKAMEIVADKAPEETMLVTIENPLERCHIAALSPKYIAEFKDLPIGTLAAVADMIETSKEKHPDGIVLPQESDMDPDAICKLEDEHNKKAVQYARETLGL